MGPEQRLSPSCCSGEEASRRSPGKRDGQGGNTQQGHDAEVEREECDVAEFHPALSLPALTPCTSTLPAGQRLHEDDLVGGRIEELRRLVLRRAGLPLEG